MVDVLQRSVLHTHAEGNIHYLSPSNGFLQALNPATMLNNHKMHQVIDAINNDCKDGQLYHYEKDNRNYQLSNSNFFSNSR